MNLGMNQNRYGSYFHYSDFSSVPTLDQLTSLESILDFDSIQQSQLLLPLAITQAPLGNELESLFHSLPPNERAGQFDFVDLIRQAYLYDQRSKERLKDLTDQLLQNELNSQEFIVWMMLRHHTNDDPSEVEISTFLKQVGSLQNPSSFELTLIARILLSVRCSFLLLKHIN